MKEPLSNVISFSQKKCLVLRAIFFHFFCFFSGLFALSLGLAWQKHRKQSGQNYSRESRLERSAISDFKSCNATTMHTNEKHSYNILCYFCRCFFFFLFFIFLLSFLLSLSLCLYLVLSLFSFFPFFPSFFLSVFISFFCFLFLTCSFLNSHSFLQSHFFGRSMKFLQITFWKEITYFIWLQLSINIKTKGRTF